MEETVMNPCGLRVKKCCASCMNKYVDEEGVRFCPVLDKYVNSCDVCNHWAMDYNTSQAGVCRGRVHRKEYLMFVLAIRVDEAVKALQAKKQGEPIPKPRSIESIRREYEEDFGSTIILNI